MPIAKAALLYMCATKRQKCISVQAQLPAECRVDLPEVVVVGSQSSGKSSVLESLVCSCLHDTASRLTHGTDKHHVTAARWCKHGRLQHVAS